MKFKKTTILLLLTAIFILSGCSSASAKGSVTTMPSNSAPEQIAIPSEPASKANLATLLENGNNAREEQDLSIIGLGQQSKRLNERKKEEQTATPRITGNNTSKELVVCIDPGHQAKANGGQEPIGPGASTTKSKVTGGTTGVATGITEYQLTLDISLMLQKELESRGYKVVMTRTSNDVDISNSERAAVANDVKADAFIRIHANGGGASNQGALTMCQTADNPYNGNLHSQSFALSQAILNHLCSTTGCKNLGVSQVDNMSGINWAKVPVTIVEMGFMSNAEEDRKMADPSYRQKMVLGIADGIDEYLKK